MFDSFNNAESIFITLDVDNSLFNRLKQITLAGFSTVEINSCDESLFKKILSDFPSLRIGASNIISTEQVEYCCKAGVHFMSSPGFLPALAHTANVYAMNYIPGIATLSEAMQIISAGCQQARPYPASFSFCTLLNKCLPSLKLFPAEVEWDEVEHYLSLPSVVGVSVLNPASKQLTALAAAVFA